MTTIHMHATTTATPEQFLASLVDFGPGRSKVFPNSADAFLKVHASGPDWADVTEGSRPAWERLRYDWSDPMRVTMKTTDSNIWGGASGHTYTFKRQSDGKTAVDVKAIRDGKNAKGRVVAFLLKGAGKRVLNKGLTKTVEAIEARNDDGPSAPQSTAS